jgi:hypothetical protein
MKRAIFFVNCHFCRQTYHLAYGNKGNNDEKWINDQKYFGHERCRHFESDGDYGTGSK